MNFLVESALNELLIQETSKPGDKNSLEFLDEYLAAKRGITISEAKNLISLVEAEEVKAINAILEARGKAKAKTKKAVKNKQVKIAKSAGFTLGDLAGKGSAMGKTAMAKRRANQKLASVSSWGKRTGKSIDDWARKNIGKVKGMSKKQKMAIAGAAVGLGGLGGGLAAYQKYRRKKAEA